MSEAEKVKIDPVKANAAADLLESTGDYKVLRRMFDWPEGEPLTGEGLARVAILDTETTGLDPVLDRTIEIGIILRAVDIEKRCFVGPAKRASFMEDPGFELEPQTVALTGITDADVKGKKFDEAAIKELLTGVDLIVAHNAWHDRPFFESRFPKMRKLPWGCTYDQVDWKEAGYGTAKIDYILFRLGMFHDGHRALPDCQALGHIMEKAKTETGQTVLAQLIERAGLKDFKIHATGAPFDAKDELKSRGYYWDAERKVWHTTVVETEVDNELDWLHLNVYSGRSAKVEVAIFGTTARYSDEPAPGTVTVEMRSIGSQSDRPTAVAGRGARFGSGGGSSIARRY